MQLTTAALTTFTLITSALAAPSPTTSTIPTPAGKAYAPGWCTFHLNLWVPDNGEWLVEHKPFTAQIPDLLDANHNQIGSSSDYLPVTGATFAVDSALPYTLVVASTGLDAESHDGVLNFSYGDDFWNSSSPQCSGFGGNSGHGFGSAINQLDCGFTCN